MNFSEPKTAVSIDQLDPRHHIIIKGARVNNLKHLDVAIPRNKLVVITGLSGSGKSSLAFDTLFAEGQRMYVESLSSYARQFLGRLEKPEVDYIRGLSPAIAIEQKVNTQNPRSTVGTTTEIYDYLKLFFARIGKTIDPKTGKEVSKDSVTDVINFIFSLPADEKIMISCPLHIADGRTVIEELKLLLSKGYTRVLIDNEPQFIEDLIDAKTKKKEFEILIDRAKVTHGDEDLMFRLSDSVQTAFFESHGDCFVYHGTQKSSFSDRFESDGEIFEEPTVNFFSFNNPYGACKRCEGFGNVLGIDPDLVIPDKKRSVFEGAIAPWKTESMQAWQTPLVKHGIDFDFPIHRAIEDLTPEQVQLLWDGNSYFKGLNQFFEHLESKVHKIQYRVLLSRYRGKTSCPDCKGSRLRKDAHYVKIGDKSIIDLVLMPINNLSVFFEQLNLSENDNNIASRLLTEITTRLNYLQEVGLGYLTLNRVTGTLSGGEFQRIKLATSLGSALVGSIYVLDEPSIGLHPRDTNRLIGVLMRLRDLGNTVIVVEHEEEVMRAADQLIDIGPGAGALGGELVFQGNLSNYESNDRSYTIKYLNGEMGISMPKSRRKAINWIEIVGARENNLKNITVKIPLHSMCAITGVSGSGKSTLIHQILYPALGRRMGIISEIPGKHDRIDGDLDKIDLIEFVDQNPIGKSSRSNPVTYVKAYDPIRQLFSDQPISKQRGYKPSHFSFNVDGGRCEECQGDGVVKIEMQFMADINLMCDSCKGGRFKREILDVEYNGLNISQILNLTIDEAMEFFQNERGIINKLKPLQDVGMGYIKLGQSSNTLSGGEAQRVKLASFLGRPAGRSHENILFIFDEPTTGLHFHDVAKLLKSLNELVNQGNSVLIIEHNLDVIKSADWIIDLGPDGGDAGGNICHAGTPEDFLTFQGNSYTADFLKERISK